MSDLHYLLQELLNWDDDKPIQVKDLTKMIEKSIKSQESDNIKADPFERDTQS